LTIACLLAAAATVAAAQSQDGGDAQSFRFRSGVELVNVTVTVADASGRFVPNLRKEDFTLYDEGSVQTITHFSAERSPVSLGIVLDSSDSMEGEKMHAARTALNRLLFDLLEPQDEVFLYRFDERPVLVQGWTTDRRLVSRALERINPNGATAMYDAVAEAIPLVESGRHRKKSLLVISDGNDTASMTRLAVVQRQIRESEALVYAIGIDAANTPRTRTPTPFPPRRPVPLPPPPFPRPGRRPPGWPFLAPAAAQTPPIWSRSSGGDEPVNVDALRGLTDDSGGRTEIVRSPQDLDPATASVAHELSQQYYLGYPAPAADGRWHAISVNVRNAAHRVRARRGYVASEERPRAR
jgi:VWFA-related protein